MKIALTYSRFNGLEYLIVHKAELWRELTRAIEQIDADGSDPAQISHALAGLIASDERIALGFQREGMVATSDALARHYLRYARDEIDVGIQIMPIEFLKDWAFSGASRDGDMLHNVIRNGRGVPAVPLVMIGIAP